MFPWSRALAPASASCASRIAPTDRRAAEWPLQPDYLSALVTRATYVTGNRGRPIGADQQQQWPRASRAAIQMEEKWATKSEFVRPSVRLWPLVCWRGPDSNHHSAADNKTQIIFIKRAAASNSIGALSARAQLLWLPASGEAKQANKQTHALLIRFESARHSGRQSALPERGSPGRRPRHSHISATRADRFKWARGFGARTRASRPAVDVCESGLVFARDSRSDHHVARGQIKLGAREFWRETRGGENLGARKLARCKGQLYNFRLVSVDRWPGSRALLASYFYYHLYLRRL